MEGGAAPAGGEVLEAPLPLSARPGEDATAPVTFGQYFEAVIRMLSGPGEVLLRRAVGAALSCPGPYKGLITEVEIRSERHGAFYHPARIRAVTGDGPALLAGNVAVSPSGLALVESEGKLLTALSGQAPSGLPALYGTARAPLDQGRETRMLLVEWFEDFSEFHLDGGGGISVWDDDRGHFTLGPDRAAGVYEAAGRILALYYDPDTALGVTGWNQAAGDFVARVDGNGTQVRLVTARALGSLTEPGDVLSDAFWFVLNTSLRLRLDRVLGTGPWGLAGDWSVAPILRGLLAGLSARAARTGRHPDLSRNLLELLSGLGEERLEAACRVLAGSCDPCRSETSLLAACATAHGQALGSLFQAESPDLWG